MVPPEAALSSAGCTKLKRFRLGEAVCLSLEGLLCKLASWKSTFDAKEKNKLIYSKCAEGKLGKFTSIRAVNSFSAFT